MAFGKLTGIKVKFAKAPKLVSVAKPNTKISYPKRIKK